MDSKEIWRMTARWRVVLLVALVGSACGGGGGGGGSQPGPFAVDADTVALWHFDEGQGQSAEDASPNHYDLHFGPTTGIDPEDPYWTEGRFGSCLHCVTAEGDYATALHSVTLPRNAASVELWFRATVSGGTLFNAGMVTFHLTWMGGSPGYFAFGIGDGGGWDDLKLDQSWNSTIADGQWHYLAATYDGATLRLYLDGQEIGAAPGNRVLDPIQEFHVGGRPTHAFIDGDIDEVRFSSRAREAAEIAAYWASLHP